MKTINNQDVTNKKVIVRVGFDVPLGRNNEVIDDSRIKASLSTINYLLDHNAAQIILISHLGRPKGEVVQELKLSSVASRLLSLLEIKGSILSVKIGEFPAYQISEKIYLLENIRFYPEEERNDPEFAKKLASLGDLFVNDAFSCSHRAHVSTEGITHFLPSFAGFALEKEFETLLNLVQNPKRPFVCILGGAKVADKIDVIDRLASKVDWFLLGGVMASTFLATMDIHLKQSVVANDKIEVANNLFNKYKKQIILPTHFVWGDLGGGKAILDVDQSNLPKFTQYIKDAGTIFWNGNLGKTENPEYARFSTEIAKEIVRTNALTIVAGGDTTAFVNKIGLTNKFSYISLGGGATLEFLAGKKLPALQALL
ncbi:MAG: phosphoglycerate kinase [Candidatus Berkelbacteria bacterium]|nr:phosphoglycerate kinase [Candidatus Berkelbacteria bacterium]